MLLSEQSVRISVGKRRGRLLVRARLLDPNGAIQSNLRRFYSAADPRVIAKFTSEFLRLTGIHIADALLDLLSSRESLPKEFAADYKIASIAYNPVEERIAHYLAMGLRPLF